MTPTPCGWPRWFSRTSGEIMKTLGILSLAWGLLLMSIASAWAEDSPEAILARAKTVLAPLEGDVQLAGLKEPVEVLRDRWGIPHIYAEERATTCSSPRGSSPLRIGCFSSISGVASRSARRPRFSATRRSRPTASPACLHYRGDMQAEWTSYAPGYAGDRHGLHQRHQRLHRPDAGPAADRVSDRGLPAEAAGSPKTFWAACRASS